MWSIGLIAAALSLFSSTWLTRFADFTLVLGSLLVPVGGILVAHYSILNRPTRVADLYETGGPYARHGGWAVPGLAGWAAGSIVYVLSAPIGSTLPSLIAPSSSMSWRERSFGSLAPPPLEGQRAA